jgi:vacuolar-type H+-ATPase subunit I/STV1
MPKFMLSEVIPKLIGYREDGSPIWLFQGGAPEDDDDGSNDGGKTGEGDGDPEGEKGKEDDSDDDDDDDDGAGDEGLPESVKAILKKNRDELKAERRKRKEAEQARDAASGKVRDFEDKDKSEIQRAQETADREKERADNAEKKANRLALRNAFLSLPDVAWVDPDDAVDFALNRYGLQDLEVDDDGKVDKKSIKAIAKKLSDEKPYLVKAPEESGGKPTGGSFNGGKKPRDTTNEAALASKYPAIRGRRKVE